MITIGLFGEGVTDVGGAVGSTVNDGRKGDLDPSCRGPVTVWIERWLRSGGGAERDVGEMRFRVAHRALLPCKLTRGKNKAALIFLHFHKDLECDAVIYFRDVSQRPADAAEEIMRFKALRDHENKPVAIAVPFPAIEAWMLADEEALRKWADSTGKKISSNEKRMLIELRQKKPGRASSKETIKAWVDEAKAFLSSLAKNRGFKPPDAYCGIAERQDQAICRRELREFEDFISDLKNLRI